jgi:tRNA-2-methylthio-N6-dimethylallyladenosine synthase
LPKKIFIKTFGCQMNEYDSNRIYDLVSSIGFSKTKVRNQADCFLLNTCHIREKATEKVYDEIGRVKKTFKSLKKPLVIVSGCVAQAESEEMIKREPYIDMVIGPQSYHKIGDLILNYERKKAKINETEFDVVKKFDELQKIPNSENKISSYLTIQEGCDKFCHFCVVPYTRGPEYSRPFRQVLDEANTLVENGVREIILLGQNVNAYNYSKNNKNFTLSKIIKELNNIKNLKRIRYMTSHPNDMTDDLINCYSECEKLMPLLHLPIQSGSDKILKLMNRKHNKKYYLSVIEKLKKANNEIKISSDFIVGYPGEEEEDFHNTIDLIKKIGFISSYSFIFSPRPGTPAAVHKINNLLISEERLKKMQYILSNLQYKNNENFIGEYCEVLIENKLENQEKYFGRTKYMTPVIFDSAKCDLGETVNVQITSINQKNLFGFHRNNKFVAA